MRALSRLLLSIFAPWSGFLTANISGLPGVTKSDGERTRLGADTTKEPDKNDPNELARYLHDKALDEKENGDVEAAKRLMQEASDAGATNQYIIDTIKKSDLSK